MRKNTQPLVSVTSTHEGDHVEAITGSPKTKDLKSQPGRVVGFTTRQITPWHQIREAVVQTAEGKTVTTHRLRRA